MTCRKICPTILPPGQNFKITPALLGAPTVNRGAYSPVLGGGADAKLMPPPEPADREGVAWTTNFFSTYVFKHSCPIYSHNQPTAQSTLAHTDVS